MIEAFPPFLHPIQKDGRKSASLLIEDSEIFVAIDVAEEEDDPANRAFELGCQLGWKKAIEAVFPDPDFQRYVSSSERLSILDVLPLNAEQAALEIGPGYGQMTVAIANKVKTLDAIEASIGQARFCALRCAQEKITNLRVVAGGIQGSLPYEDDSFDIVIMNLVLEWCAYRAAELGHQAVQEAFLNEISRVLKPGGRLFLSTKNRFSLRLLLGGRDEHAQDMRFGSALPRWLTEQLSRGRSGKWKGGYLHSYPALKKMIKDAGFSEVKGLWAAPDMRWPMEFIPLERAAISAARARKNFKTAPGRISSKIIRILPVALVKYITPGLTFLATKSQR